MFLLTLIILVLPCSSLEGKNHQLFASAGTQRRGGVFSMTAVVRTLLFKAAKTHLSPHPTYRHVYNHRGSV